MTSHAFTSDGLDRIQAMAQQFVDRREVAGFVTAVHRKGESVIQTTGVQDFDTGTPMSENTVFRIASMSKAVSAVAALQLIDSGQLSLDDPVSAWLPELAAPRVLRTIESELDDTVPVERPIVVRDLMRFTFGLGAIMTGEVPISATMAEAGVSPGAHSPAMDPDRYMAQIATLPLAHQPGKDWLYHTGSDVLGVLLQRLTGTSLESHYRTHIFEPLGMPDTGFSVPEAAIDRFATAYEVGDSGALQVFDPAVGSAWAAPEFEAAGGGLVSTAPDYLRFARMLMGGGEPEGTRVVSEASVREMTHDQITPEEHQSFPSYAAFQGENGWGYGVSVTIGAGPLGHAEGTYGWVGGLNTHWTNDPANDLVGLILFQRQMTGPHDMETSGAIWKAMYGAIPA